MTVAEIMLYLESKGSEQTKKTLMNHGAPASGFFGVKVGDMKPIQKKIKKNHEISKALFETGNSDAMYLAGLIADEKKITKDDLNFWAKNASWFMISEYTVPWIASESPFGWELAFEWIDNSEEKIASAGWATLSNWIALEGKSYDLEDIKKLLKRVENTIHQEQNRVRYTMNGFLISAAIYIPSLLDEVMEMAKKIGAVKVNLGNTACKVPFAPDYIQKTLNSGRANNLKKMARC